MYVCIVPNVSVLWAGGLENEINLNLNLKIRPVRLLPYPDRLYLILLIYGRHFGKQQLYTFLLETLNAICLWNCIDLRYIIIDQVCFQIIYYS
jgi:hypothetical protein